MVLYYRLKRTAFTFAAQYQSTHMKKPMLFLTAILFATVLFAQRVSIQPSILDFHLGAKGVQAQPITITNLSDQKIAFRAYLADWLRDSTGSHQYFRPDTLKRSCASWVRLNKNFIEIEPGKSGELLVQLQAPADTAGFRKMKWAMLFLQSSNEQDAASRADKQVQTQVKELLRIGIHIYQTPPFLTQYQAKAVSLQPIATAKNSYEMTMKNTGEVMLQCKAYMELTNVADGKEYKLDKIEFPVFPDGVRKVRFDIPEAIPVGKYSALAILDIGEEMPLEAIEKTIEIK